MPPETMMNGQIQFTALQEFQSFWRAELGKVVIGKNDVPALLVQCPVHGFARLNTFRHDLVTAFANEARDHLSVEL